MGTGLCPIKVEGGLKKMVTTIRDKKSLRLVENLKLKRALFFQTVSGECNSTNLGCLESMFDEEILLKEAD